MNVAEPQTTVRVVDPLVFTKQRTPEGIITTDAHAPQAAAAPADPSAPEPSLEAPKAPAAPDAPDADDLTPEEKILAGIADEGAAKPAWTDEQKKFFKDHTGYDDPDAYRSEFTKLQEEHRLLGEESKGLKALKGAFEKMDPHVKRAFELEQREKGAGQKYLKGLPDVDMLSKDAKKIGDKQLLDTYVPDHGVTDEEWAVLSDPEADPAEASALKKRIGHLRSIGEDMHARKQGEYESDRKSEAEANDAAWKRFNEGKAAAIAYAKNGPLKAFVTPEHIKEIEQGTFVNRFFEDDGVTPKPTLLDAIIKAERFEEAREAARKAAYRKGKSDGLAEGTSGLPTSPRPARSAAAPVNPKTNAYAATLDAIERKVGRG